MWHSGTDLGIFIGGETLRQWLVAWGKLLHFMTFEVNNMQESN